MFINNFNIPVFSRYLYIFCYFVLGCSLPKYFCNITSVLWEDWSPVWQISLRGLVERFVQGIGERAALSSHKPRAITNYNVFFYIIQFGLNTYSKFTSKDKLSYIKKWMTNYKGSERESCHVISRQDVGRQKRGVAALGIESRSWGLIGASLWGIGALFVSSSGII